MAVYSFEHYSDEQHAATKEACEKVYEVLNGLSKKSFEDGGGRELDNLFQELFEKVIAFEHHVTGGEFPYGEF